MNARRLCAVALALAVATSAASAASLQVTVLARDGQPLADAVVTVEMPGMALPATPAPVNVTIDQQAMRFVPSLTVVPLGSRIRFSNLDSWDHHVRAIPPDSGSATTASEPRRGFELRLPGRPANQAAPHAEGVVDSPGPWRLGCHLHGSMRGHVWVSTTPWVGKTDRGGVALISDLPEGAAVLKLWHPEQVVEATPQALTLSGSTATRLSTAIQPRRR